jgi:tRNA (guanine-N7-)-methyltransferase
MKNTVDDDFGVPIPGDVLPPEQWARTAIKRLPPPGFVDWAAVFDREAACTVWAGNGRYVINSA